MGVVAMTSVSLTDVRAESRSRAASVPWIIPIATLATTSIVVGSIWDISWHRTIGRDTFWTAAHMAIYLGGILAGLCGAWLILHTTFAAAGDTAASVKIWGFRGPLGAWIAIWGATAMLTSAPFDDWWHNAYGLDVKILSPPHAVLGLGMIAIQIAMMVLLLSHQNRAAGGAPVFARAFTYAVGALVLMLGTILMEETLPNNQHRAVYYKLTGAVFPLFLVAAARAGRAGGLRWPATGAAAVYTAVSLVMTWVLPLFPGRPLLAPIYIPVDHMVPPGFPLLLLLPALAIDWLMQRVKGHDWLLAIALGAAFVWIHFVVQYWFSEFMLSPASEGWFFAGRQWGYQTRPTPWLYKFWWVAINGVSAGSLMVASLMAAASSRMGLWWGSWMARVVR
jgi:hypothetical protein